MAKILQPDLLREWYENGQIDQVLIVDVREHDFKTSKLKGSINLPFNKLQDSLPDLSVMLKGKTKVIFHCHYSQVRGPSAAAIFEKHSTQQDIDVYVLEGGWKLWHTYCSLHSLPHLMEPLN